MIFNIPNFIFAQNIKKWFRGDKLKFSQRFIILTYNYDFSITISVTNHVMSH